VAFAYAKQDNATLVNALTGPYGNDQDTWNIGGAYDFGFLKVLGYYDHDKRNNQKEDRFHISTVIPLGQGEVHLGYSRSKLDNSLAAPLNFDNTIYQWAATYQYNLSKRTAMYGTYSQLNNGGHSAASIAGGTNQSAPPILGGNSKGFEAGIRHFF
jgi:predicted porin